MNKENRNLKQENILLKTDIENLKRENNALKEEINNIKKLITVAQEPFTSLSFINFKTFFIYNEKKFSK